MNYYSVGQVIKNTRKRQGMTQEELADGICAVSSLSRIENGKQMPHSRTFEALMQRLGESCEIYHIYLKDEDLEYRKLLGDIINGLWFYKPEVLKAKLKHYKKTAGFKHRLEQQWELVMEQLLLFWEGTDFRYIEEQLIRIIGMTIYGFHGEWIEKRGYTCCELYSIFLWTLCMKSQGKREQSMNMLKHLLYYLNQNIYNNWMFEMRERVYHHYAEILFETERERNSAKDCETGI